MTTLPLARTKNIIVQTLKEETLLYDLNSDQAFCLNQTSAIVWRACDGATDFEELKRKNKFADEIIWLALDELKKKNLLEDDGNFHLSLCRISRREMIRNAGYAAMTALPIITSLVAPAAAQAQSGVCSGACTCSVRNTVNLTTGVVCRLLPDPSSSTGFGTSNCASGVAGVTCDCIVTASSFNGVCIGA